jgi:hypothetical protein
VLYTGYVRPPQAAFYTIRIDSMRIIPGPSSEYLAVAEAIIAIPGPRNHPTGGHGYGYPPRGGGILRPLRRTRILCSILHRISSCHFYLIAACEQQISHCSRCSVSIQDLSTSVFEISQRRRHSFGAAGEVSRTSKLGLRVGPLDARPIC